MLGGGSEALGSPYAWANCTKNPGHTHFIPAPEFCTEHLPNWCADPKVVECVRCLAALTVRLRVTYTSWGRPDGYSFAKNRGSYIQHTGTGWVRNVTLRSGGCTCPVCSKSSTPSQEWYEVQLETACHVVYNTEEAQTTKVDFFYDDESSKVDGWTETVLAFKTKDPDQEGDNCILFCATHDHELAKMLRAYLTKAKKYRLYRDDEVYFSTKWLYLCVIVSHPHGQPKQVTLTTNQPTLILKDFHMHFTYTTDTCPGSSGAPVLVLIFARPEPCKFPRCYPCLLPPHSECLPKQRVNQSSATWIGYSSPTNLYTNSSQIWGHIIGGHH